SRDIWCISNSGVSPVRIGSFRVLVKVLVVDMLQWLCVFNAYCAF
ncbi:MAG: hypothetical protein ACI901_000856, partial [Octadecabacter sp.]